MNNEHPNLIFHPEDLGPATRTSQWDHRVIELKRADDPPKNYALALSTLLTGVDHSGCKWQKIPRTIVVLTREKDRLKRLGINSYPALTISRVEDGPASCGSVREFFKDYQ